MLCCALCMSQCKAYGHIKCLVYVVVVHTFLLIDFNKIYRFSVITNVRVVSTNAADVTAACSFNIIREDTL